MDISFAKSAEEASKKIPVWAENHTGRIPLKCENPSIIRMPLATQYIPNASADYFPRPRMAVAIHCQVSESSSEQQLGNVFLAAYPEVPNDPRSDISYAVMCGHRILSMNNAPRDLGSYIVNGMIHIEQYPNNRQAKESLIAEMSNESLYQNGFGQGCQSSRKGMMIVSCDHIIKLFQEIEKDNKGELRSLYNDLWLRNSRDLMECLKGIARADLICLYEGKPLEPLEKRRVNSSVAETNGSHSTSKPLTPEEQRVLEMVTFEQEHAQRGSFSKEVTRLISVANYKPARVLVVGPAGVGKSNALRTMGTDKRLFPGGYHEIQLMPDTEPKDLLGGYYPTVNQETKQKSYEYVEGPLIAAMQAAKEQRTMLNLEEIGNAPHLTRIFKGLFNPHDGKYTLNIDKPEAKDGGSFGLTSVSCPVQNLVVVGSANAGDGYSLDLGDRAVRDRFVILRYGIDRDLLCRAFRGSDEAKEKLLEYRTDEQKAIFAIFTPGKGHSHDAKFCDYAKIGILQVSTEVQEAVMKGEVEAPLSIRAIAETAQITPPNDRDAFVANLKMFGQNSARMLPDGTMMFDQVQKMNDIIDQFL